ncbi:MAG: HD-GYP domain-containing protein, partial [Aeoliella sp.]
IIQCGSDLDTEYVSKPVGLGENFMSECQSSLMRIAATIAATHHEKWDGSGYPRGLSGEQIPIEGRITAVADVFDALTSDRPYKQAFALEKSLAIMDQGRGSHFDPDVLDAFTTRRPDILQTMVDYADQV